MSTTELNPTAAVVAQAIKKEADLLAEQGDSHFKDIRFQQLYQVAERIATDLHLHGKADRQRFLKACGLG